MLHRSQARASELEKALQAVDHDLAELVDERTQYKKNLQDLNEQ